MSFYQRARRSTAWRNAISVVMCATALIAGGRARGEQLALVEVAPQWTTALRLHGSGDPFIAVGVNYFGPHDGWAPKLWHRFDPAGVRQHLEMLRAQGFNVIRVFLTLDSFHREAGQVHADGVAKFRQLLDICRDLEIRVVPSGPDHWEGIPAWLQGQDSFADEDMLRAQEAWWESFTALFQDDPVILAWDLLNEPAIRWESPAMRAKWNTWLVEKYGTLAQIAAAHARTPEQLGALGELAVPAPDAALRDPQLYDYQLFRESIADNWTRRLVAAIRRGDARHLVTVGHIQWAGTAYLPSVKHYAAFNLQENARHVDFVTVHFYPIAPPRPCDSPEGLDVNAQYLETLLHECSAGKPMMIGEFAWYGGGAIQSEGRVIMPEQSWEDQVAWNTRLLEVSRGRVCGWLNWAFADTPSSRDLTRWSGLWTEDLELKPWGRVFGEFAREATRQAAPVQPFSQLVTGREIDRQTALTSPGLWFLGDDAK